MRKGSAGLKVEIAFGCLVALLVGVGWLGLSRMGQINASDKRLFDERWEKLYATRQAASYFNSNYRIAIRVFLMEPDQEETAALVAQLKENTLKGSAGWKKIEAEPANAVERDLLHKVDTAAAPAYESLQQALSLRIDQRKAREANKIMLGQTLPLLNKYREAWSPYLEYEEDQMNQARLQTKASYATVRRLSTIMVLLAIGLAVCIAVFVTRKLSREMRGRESAQFALRNLNEDLERKVTERTEDLARTVDTLREVVNERGAQEVDLRRLAAIVESSDDAIIAITLDQIITNWNPGAERMLGYQRGEMIGQPISRILPPDRLGEPTRSLQRLVSGDRVDRQETVRVRKDGKEIHVLMTVSPLRDTQGNVIGDSAILRDISERKMMEDALRRSEAGFRSLVDNAPYGILRTKPDGRILQANPAMVRMLGYACELEMLALNVAKDVYRDAEGGAETTAWCATRDSMQGFETEWKRKDGSVFLARCDAHVVRDNEDYLECLETFVEDVTERREMEQQLRQGQKMEAVGRLAGGIAHDFNNLLGVISGYAELVLEQIQPASPVYNPVEQIRKAAERASSLTRQLLAFSRQQVLETKVLNLNAIVEDMSKMLPRLLGEDVELHVSLDPELGAVKADQGQIEQVIMNLAVNARDAMPGGGKLAIHTARLHFDSELALKHPPMTPGDYVLLSVSDTGMGMDKQTQTRIFEPFFTTKERGRGTGLGLATVYGFVKQIGGYVWVESEPGLGSKFAIYLPVTGEEAPRNVPVAAVAASGRGTGTILLVEDEESLRTLTRSILEDGGYTVIEACNGLEAVEIARDSGGPIRLLLTDMVMPGMNGRVVAEKVGQLCPGIRVAYMSGYTGFSAREAASLDAVIIAKPFTRNVLLQKLSEALELAQKPMPT
ncbi:MAG TPA: PAS domain S-box protein [Candidatus Acidoferrales bacterium]|jgi:PAS domain S-box-containing protein|nr:PAS domain S-box protein [Candidatus Acidoferrales bacterium]